MEYVHVVPREGEKPPPVYPHSQAPPSLLSLVVRNCTASGDELGGTWEWVEPGNEANTNAQQVIDI